MKFDILKTLIMTAFAGATPKNLELTCHSEGTNVTEVSLACHPEERINNEALDVLYSGSLHGSTNKKEILKETLWKTIHFSRNQKISEKVVKQVQGDVQVLCKKCAFTLAETMIVLVILGVVAAITVPALVNRHVEAERKTKLRKAMTVYESALNKMVIENGIKSDTALTNWADSDTKNDCANTSVYFKAARNLEVNGNATNCKFRAPDGVFWDISDIKKPLVALREQDLNDATAQSDTNRAFYMFGWFDEQGSLRSNDMGKIDATNKADLEKLYDFINGKIKTSLGEIASGEEKPKSFLDDCDKIDDTHYNCGGTTFIPKTGNGACVNITTGPLKGTQSCGPDENTTVWVPENPISSSVYGADAKSVENCATSTYGACRTFGDYYKTAKSYCESRGTHIATAGELISLGYTSGYFWTSDENDSDQPYTLRGRFVDTNYTKGHKGNDIVCVGN